MDTCAATNKDGTPCSNSPVSGSKYCHVHRNQEVRGERKDADQSSPGFWTVYAYALVAIFAAYLLYTFLVNLGG